MFILFLQLFQFLHLNQNLVNYSNSFYGIEYPSDWKLDTAKKMGTSFILYSPVETLLNDNFSENVNLIIQDLHDEKYDLEKYRTVSETQLNKMFTNLNIIDSRIIKEKNQEYLLMVYTFSQGKYELKIQSKCIIKKGQAYLLTFTSEFSKESLYKSIGENLLSSFSLK